MITVKCQECGKEFTKESEHSAYAALNMHRGRIHTKVIDNKPVPSPAIKEAVERALTSTPKRYWSISTYSILQAEILRLRAKDPFEKAIHLLHKAEENLLPQELKKLHRHISLYGSKVQDWMRGIMRLPIGTQPAASVVPREEPEEPEETLPAPQEPPQAPVPSPWQMIGELARLVVMDLVPRLDRFEAALISRITASVPVRTPTPPAPSVPPAVPQNSRPQPTLSLTAAPPPPKPALYHIGVVGLFRDQFEHVFQKVKHLSKFNLVWIDKEDSRVRIPPLDHIIIQRHTKHVWYDKAVSMLGHSRVSFVEGAQSGVVQKIMDIHSMVEAKTLNGGK